MATQEFSEAPAWRTLKAQRWRATYAATTSALIGVCIWAVSPFAFGHPEPWDGNVVLYLGSLFAAGVVAALIVRGPLWAHYLGTIVGQSAFVFLVLPVGALSGFAPFVIALYGLLVAVGAALVSLTRLVAGRA